MKYLARCGLAVWWAMFVGAHSGLSQLVGDGVVPATTTSEPWSGASEEQRWKIVRESEAEAFPEPIRQAIAICLERRSDREITSREILLAGIIPLPRVQRLVEDRYVEWKAEYARAPLVTAKGCVLRSTGWCAVLAKARQGDPSAMRSAVEVVDSPTLPLSQRWELFKDMAYTRQPAAVEVLKKYVNSDAWTTDPEDEGKETDYAAPVYIYAAQALGALVEDFPVKHATFDEIGVARDRIRKFMNSHKGPWRIKGRPWPPKEEARSGPGPVPPPSAAGSGSYATNGPSESTAKRSPPSSGSGHGDAGTQTGKVVAAVACGLIALTAVGVLLRRRRDRGNSGG